MIVRANMASDVAASQKLTDAEVLAQVTTFMCVPFHAFGGCARFDVPAYPS
jgi:cell division FtsZ-interacting protein ZapD